MFFFLFQNLNFFFFKTADKNFKRLTCAQPVGLRYSGYSISVDRVVKDKEGNIVELIASCVKTNESVKPKGFIQWISNGLTCEIRLYDRLFYHESPEDKEQVPGGWLSDINRNSVKIISNAIVDCSVNNAKAFDKYQFERIGYFSVDPDTTSDHVSAFFFSLLFVFQKISNFYLFFFKLVFNRTVSLKEDAEKH